MQETQLFMQESHNSYAHVGIIWRGCLFHMKDMWQGYTVPISGDIQKDKLAIWWTPFIKELAI